MRYLDLSFASNISLDGIHFLEFLFLLNLSLCGLGNVTLGDLPQLQTLDLSANRLAGVASLMLGAQ